MGRQKLHKPKRQRPLRTWDDTVHDLIAQGDSFDMEMPTLVLGPDNIPVMALPGVFGSIGGSAGSMSLPDGDAMEHAAQPLDLWELASVVHDWPGLRDNPPSEERSHEICRWLVDINLLAPSPWGGSYKVTPGGWTLLRRIFKSKSFDELQFLTKIGVSEAAEELGEADESGRSAGDDALLILFGYAYAERMKDEEPKLADKMLRADTPADGIIRMVRSIDAVIEASSD